MKYRKKPVVIEAVRFDGTIRGAHQVQDFFGTSEMRYSKVADSYIIYIPTLEGEMIARAGDWIIKGVQGEFYPCKPDIFEATYERV